MSSREWRCSWSSADRRCSNYIWVIDNFLFKGFTVYGQWSGSSLVQIMACRLFGAKPLSEPMLTYCQLYRWEQTSEIWIEMQHLFCQEIAFIIVACEVAAILCRPDCDHWLISQNIMNLPMTKKQWVADLRPVWNMYCVHYNDVIMSAMVFQITSLTIVYPMVYSGADQRKHQSSASLAFVRGIHRGPVNSPHKWPVTRKMFPFDDVTMLLWNTYP